MDETDSRDLAAYVMWVPRNGAREEHVDRVSRVVTDARAKHYWDGLDVVQSQYDEMYQLTGPCAGVFMVFGPDAVWGDGVPAPLYAEDAHAREYDRMLPQLDAKRFAGRVLEMLH